MFVAMPSIMVGLLQAITCYDTVEGGKQDTVTSHIKYHPELLCREADDMYFLIALIGLVVWVGVYPLTMLIASGVL